MVLKLFVDILLNRRICFLSVVIFMYSLPWASLDDFTNSFYQKRDSGGALTSTSERSSGMKSVSSSSTPQAESVNLHAESRLSHSLLTESSPSADLLTDVQQDRDVPEDSYMGRETPLVCNLLFTVLVLSCSSAIAPEFFTIVLLLYFNKTVLAFGTARNNDSSDTNNFILTR